MPKISLEDIPARRLCREPQLVEQLVEVPTILYFPKQRIPEQNVDIPVPHGGRGASGGLQGFLPGHVEQTVDIPAPCSWICWEMTSGPHLRPAVGWREARVGVRIRPCWHGLRCHSPWLVHLCSLPYVTPSYNFSTCSWYLAVISVSASPTEYKKLFGLGDGFTQLGSTVDTRSRVNLRSFCGSLSGSHLFVAVWCSGVIENSDFL